MPEEKKMKIAITGTIGSGKSAVSTCLREKGYTVFDCDQVNKEILEQKAYELLGNDFNDCFEKEVLNKEKLIKRVFSNENDRKKLESIMHPEILKRMNEIKKEFFFAEVPLLFETGWEQYFDRNILIVCDEKIALQRLKDRGLSKEDAQSRINSQMDVCLKMKKADEIIYNNGTLFELYQNVDECLKKILC